MNKFIIAVVLILLVCGSLVGYVYYFKEIPKQQNGKIEVYLNIYGYDKEQDILKKTGYNIYSGGENTINGTTVNLGGVREKVPYNRTLVINNYNLEEQNYYIDEVEVFTNPNRENYRIDLELVTPGEFEIGGYKNLTEDDNNGEVILTTNKLLKNVGFCIKRSNNILSTEFEKTNLTSIEKPERFSTYDKCFKINKEEITKEDFIEIEFEYILFNQLRESDNIEFVFFDGDFINKKISFDESIGQEDFNFVLK